MPKQPIARSGESPNEEISGRLNAGQPLAAASTIRIFGAPVSRAACAMLAIVLAMVPLQRLLDQALEDDLAAAMLAMILAIILLALGAPLLSSPAGGRRR